MKGFFKKDDEFDLINDVSSENGKDDKLKKEIMMNEGNVTNLTPDVEIKGTIKFNNVLKMDGKFERFVFNFHLFPTSS